MTDKANALSKLADKLFYRVENPSAWPEGFDQAGSDLFREAATTIRAFATDSHPLQSVVDRFGVVKVKPLEWHSIASGYSFQHAKTIVGHYHVSKHEGGSWRWELIHIKGCGGIADTEIDAKSCAYADYERRVLSPLATTPAPESEQEAIDENELEELADGAWGNGPASKGAARDALTKLAAPAPASEHPDDLAVDKFAAAMKAKLAIKRGEGRGGWENKNDCSAEFLSSLLRGHIEKGDPLDVGNLAMMLHQRGDAITPAPVSEITEEMVEQVMSWVRDDVLPAYGITHNSRASDPEMVEGCRAALTAAMGGELNG